MLSRRMRGLQNEHIAPAHILSELDAHFAVAEPVYIGAPQRHVQMAGDLRRERRIRIAREQRDRQRAKFICLRHRPCSKSTYRPHRKNLAGVEGFEPPNGGIKTRCLTTWRHPNLEKNRRPASTGAALPKARVSHSAREPESLQTLAAPCAEFLAQDPYSRRPKKHRPPCPSGAQNRRQKPNR